MNEESARGDRPARVYELDEVFNEAAFPEVTFVPPRQYPHIKASLKQRGKHVTISGASGTGKTTIVRRAVRDLGLGDLDVLWLNGRQFAELESGMEVLGRALRVAPTYEDVTELVKLVQLTVIDDFHHLQRAARLDIAKTLKLWHEAGARFVVIGIASSAEELYGSDPELGIRNDPFDLRAQDEAFTRALVALGEGALNVTLADELKAEIVTASNAVPSVVQVICKTCCIEAGIERTVLAAAPELRFQLRDLRESVLRVFHAKYINKVVGLAKGKRRARAVHNTYFDIIRAIASDRRSEIPTESLYREIVGNVQDRDARKRKATSFYNCLNNLADVIQEQGLEDTIFYRGSKTISIEDPTFRFYLNLLDMSEIKSRVSVRSDVHPYDVAVSFAGDVRETAEEFVRALQARGLSVFYDFDQQAQLWGQDLRVHLAQVYSSEALFMVVFLSQKYPERDWTEFEVSIGKAAAKKRTSEYLLPLLIDDVKVVGLPDAIAHVDLRRTTVDAAAELLSQKVAQNQTSDVGSAASVDPA